MQTDHEYAASAVVFEVIVSVILLLSLYYFCRVPGGL